VTRVFGRGWGTIDLERAEAELSALVDGGRFDDAERSAWLGARCRRGRAADPGAGDWIILLEPDTEGRLAAFLARHGEGWAATWEWPSDGEPGHGALAGSRPGPLGPDALSPGQPASGPFRLVTTAATIEP
jgi:hypothetical protein